MQVIRNRKIAITNEQSNLSRKGEATPIVGYEHLNSGVHEAAPEFDLIKHLEHRGEIAVAEPDWRIGKIFTGKNGRLRKVIRVNGTRVMWIKVDTAIGPDAGVMNETSWKRWVR